MLHGSVFYCSYQERVEGDRSAFHNYARTTGLSQKTLPGLPESSPLPLAIDPDLMVVFEKTVQAL